MTTTIGHRAWVAWDRLSLRWRIGNMLPVLRRVRDLEADNDRMRDELNEVCRTVSRLTDRFLPALDELLTEVRQRNGKPARPALTVVSPDETP